MSNRISGPMTAPAQEQFSKVRQNLQLPEEGPQQAILIGLVDMGTISKSFNGQAPKDMRQIMCIFEYPELKQLVYEDDTEKRSFIKYEEMTYSTYEKATFYKVIDAVNNGKYPKTEYEKINLFDFVGGRLFTSISHVKDKNNPEITYANIDSYMKVGKLPQPENFISDGNRYMFYIDAEGKNFNTENFAELPKFLREKIMKSHEAIAYKSKGGVFAEPQERTNQQQGATAPAPAPAPAEFEVPQGYSFVDKMGTGLKYADYRKSGWKNQQLLAQGFLVKNETPAAPAPTPVQTPPPPAPAPAPTADASNYDPFGDESDDDLPF